MLAARHLVACLLLGTWLASSQAEEPAADGKFAGVLTAAPEGKVPLSSASCHLRARVA
jgi:hypothetical protein